VSADLKSLREGLKDYDPLPAGLEAGLVAIRRVTLEALLDECEAARALPEPTQLDLKRFTDQYEVIGHICNGEKYRPYSYVLCSLCGPGRKIYEVVQVREDAK
jgi:hypothetical protein